jgi:RNA polymerase sigma factor (sigma-70 family)
VSTDGRPPDNCRAVLLSVDSVYRQHAVDCYRFALHIVRDRDLAHDVVQDVFESLVRDPGRFEPERGALLTWLMTLTHHKAVDLLRWRHRHVRLDLGDAPLVELADPAVSPEDATWCQIEREKVLVALGYLNPAEREVLVLAHFGGFTQTEIARRTGLPLGTVKSRTRGGLRRLRLQLDVP